MEEDNKPSTFIYESRKSIKSVFDENGMEGVSNFVNAHLEGWKSLPLNIAVIGCSGVGKSTFINTIRDLKSDDKGAAKVDVKQCTTERTAYPHPKNENILFWDVPGFGTKEYPKEEYLKCIDFPLYDFIIIISCTRFLSTDLWLADSAKELEKEFFFVRTKVNADILNTNAGRREKEPEENILTRIRDDCMQGLDSKIQMSDLFLIDCHETNRFDFNELTIQLIQRSKGLKRDSMTLTLTSFTKGVIDEKKKTLYERTGSSALVSGFGGAVPIPGLATVVVDIPMIIKEARMYRSQFGLDENNLERVAVLLQIPKEGLTEALDLKSLGISLTAKGIVVLLRMSASSYLSQIAKNSATYVPVIGSAISFGVSFWAMRRFLRSLVDLMHNDAIKINERLAAMVGTSV